MILLSIVENVFEIDGRGCVPVPGISESVLKDVVVKIGITERSQTSLTAKCDGPVESFFQRALGLEEIWVTAGRMVAQRFNSPAFQGYPSDIATALAVRDGIAFEQAASVPIDRC